MIVGIHHVQITVPRGSEAEARQFYCDVLGLREVEKPESLRARGGFWLQVGDRSCTSESKTGLTVAGRRRTWPMK